MRTVSTHCKKMLCKISRSEVHGLRSVWHGYQTGIGCVFLSMCVFLYTRVFYHCPTTSVAPRLENTCRPGRKSFHFQNHYRPCVGHATARATPDAVHRVTVPCDCVSRMLCSIDSTWVVDARSWRQICDAGQAVAPGWGTMCFATVATGIVDVC
jgi:hypothetical protein